MNSIISTNEQEHVLTADPGNRVEENIGKLLLDAGKLKVLDMDRVVQLQQSENLRFGEAALKLGLVSEADIQQALAHQFSYPYIPEAEAGLNSQLVAATAPYGKEAEILRSVRSELLLRWFRDGRKTLAIGSAGEGASFLAANMAVLFAQMRYKVLLIDTDMREGTQREIFNLGSGLGLSDILAERVSTIKVSPIKPFNTLAVLHAGSTPPNPAELLGRPTFGALLSSVEANYDIVLLNTASSLVSSDFQQVAARAGGMLIGVRRNVTRMANLVELKERIALSGADIVGAVILD